MILSTVFLAKVLLAVGTVVIFFHEFRDRLSRRWLAYITAAILICAVVVNYAVSFLPPMTEEVTLTALGEKQEAAKGMEVYLSGYTVDGKSYISGKSLEIVEGKWFWRGDTYAWRPETDSRQPEGITRTVVLKIPVGWNRTLDFDSCVWRGMVEISAGGRKWVIDTYSESGTTYSEVLARSRSSYLILNQLRYLILYIVIFIILSIAGIKILFKASQDLEKKHIWIRYNSGKLLYAGIALVSLILMFHYADKFSLWLDEMHQIHFTKGSLIKAIQHCLNLEDSSPPLGLLCSTIWYHVAPYGEQWLLLPSMSLTAGTIFTMGIIGEKIHGKYFGILTTLFTAFSITIWLNAAYEYRSYPYLIFFSAVTMYCYMRKNETGESKNLLLFGFAMAGLSMTHYFGMIICAIYFFADLFLVLKRKIKWKSEFIYFIPGLVSAFWMVLILFYQGREVVDRAVWLLPPNMKRVNDALYFMSGQIDISYYALLLGFATAFVYGFFVKMQEKRKFDWAIFYLALCAVSVFCVMFILYLYGAFINPKSSLWAERYFLSLYPYVVILIALGVYMIMTGTSNEKKKIIIMFMAGVLSLKCVAFISTSSSLSLYTYGNGYTRTSEPYREAADWIYTQNYIFNDDTVVIVVKADSVADGWNEYYISRKGKRDKLNVISQYIIYEEGISKYNKIYLYYSGKVAGKLQSVLNEEFVLETDQKDIKVRVYNRK